MTAGTFLPRMSSPLSGAALAVPRTAPFAFSPAHDAAEVASPVLRIAIADDHAVVRSGYRRLLELDASMQIVAEFGDGESAYRWLAANEADILILDLTMPGRGGLATLERLRRRVPRLRILIFTMHESPDLAEQALRGGAGGYITKSSPPESLVCAVRDLAGGHCPVSPDIARSLAERNRKPVPTHVALSPREFDIFLLLAQGRSVDRISAMRSLSAKTVSNYQTAIRQKTGLASSLEMYRYAETHGLISTASPLDAQ